MAREEIGARLSAFRRKLKDSFPASIDRRVALLQILRCYDYLRLSGPSTYGKPDGNSSEDYYHVVEDEYIWGLNEALKLMWHDTTKTDEIPLFTSDAELISWGNSLLICSGRVRLIEHVLELERLQLAQIAFSSDGVAHCHLNGTGLGSESIEKKDFYYQAKLIEDDYQRKQIWEQLSARRPDILRRMEKLVSPFHTHYIQYGAEPEIDEYYSDYARARALKCFGWDSFPPTALFGGIKFGLYLEAATMLIGFAKKHIDFCNILCKRHPEISSIDILPIPGRWEDSCRYLSYAIGSSVEQADQILSTTTLCRDNVDHHLGVPASAPALHYLLGNKSAVRLVTSCLNDPFTFMLREMRRRFKSDWDSSVDDREHMFRNLLITAFAPFGYIVFFGDNIQISSDAGATDIDAFAYDPKAGIAAVFQLKWQDPFGSSMRERESRKANFLDNGNVWVNKVCRWIEQGKFPSTISSLGMPDKMAQNVKQILIFVLGRHFSHFSGNGIMDKRAAWGTFPQLLRLLRTKASGQSPLTILYDLIKADSPHKRLPANMSIQEIRINGLQLIVHPPTKDSVS